MFFCGAGTDSSRNMETLPVGNASIFQNIGNAAPPQLGTGFMFPLIEYRIRRRGKRGAGETLGLRPICAHLSSEEP